MPLNDDQPTSRWFGAHRLRFTEDFIPRANQLRRDSKRCRSHFQCVNATRPARRDSLQRKISSATVAAGSTLPEWLPNSALFSYLSRRVLVADPNEIATMYNVTLIPGDGVGPEIAQATRKCVEAT